MLEDVLKEWGSEEVSAMDVYSDIFHLGEGWIQKENGESRNMKANPIAYWKNNDEEQGHFRILFEDTFSETLKELQKADFCIVNGLSYFGRRNLQANASKMYALIFDLDGVTDRNLNAFLSGAIRAKAYPVPNYIALSGHGVHLYYLFEEPVSLYPNLKIQLKELKYALTEKMWNPFTSEEEKVQYQGINQGFRVIGGKTKIEGLTVRAFKVWDHPHTIGSLCDHVLEKYKVDENMLWQESRLSLEEAKKKYPEWYQKRVIEGEKLSGHWTCKRDLYDWWKRQIEAGASFHHRYFNIMCLAIYGVKSGISEEEVAADAYGLIPFMNKIAPDEPFTEEDVESALECFDERYITFPIDDISRLSGITIEKNKRNNLKQSQHLYLSRRRKEDMKTLGIPLKGKEGRPEKKSIVTAWRMEHPEGKKADCIKSTGLSKPTVYKYWKD